MLFSSFVYGCQYQCNRLPGKTGLRNDLLCVEWDVKILLTQLSSLSVSLSDSMLAGRVPVDSLLLHFLQPSLAQLVVRTPINFPF